MIRGTGRFIRMWRTVAVSSYERIALQRFLKMCVFQGLITCWILLLCYPTHAEQKYDAYNDKWVTTTSDSQMKYDAYNDQWGYHTPSAQQEYNAYEDEWEWTDTGGDDDD